MDTLWLAGETEEFARCLRWVATSMELDTDQVRYPPRTHPPTHPPNRFIVRFFKYIRFAILPSTNFIISSERFVVSVSSFTVCGLVVLVLTFNLYLESYCRPAEDILSFHGSVVQLLAWCRPPLRRFSWPALSRFSFVS